MNTKEKEIKKAQPERASVSLEGLKKEFGDAEGEAKYTAIATLPAQGGALFFNPLSEGPGYRPDLQIATLTPDQRAKVAEIVSTPQVKEN